MWLRSIVAVDAKDLPVGVAPADHGGTMSQIARTFPIPTSRPSASTCAPAWKGGAAR